MTPRCITRQRSGYGSVGSGWAARGKGRRGWPMASGGRREAVLPGPWVRGAWRRGIGRADVGARAGGTDGRRGASASGPRGSHGGRARGVARRRRAARALERRVPEHFGLTYFD
jgi:hypothetical protein